MVADRATETAKDPASGASEPSGSDEAGGEQALRESEERYRALVEASASLIWRNRTAGVSVENSGGRQFAGRESDHLGLGWLRFVHPEDRDAAIAAWAEAERSGSGFERIERKLSRDGSYRWVRVKVVPIRNADGSVREWVGATTDIHEQHMAALRLRESESRYRALVEASAAIVWRAAPDGAIVEADGWEAFSGQGPDAYKGGGWLAVVHPEDRERVASYWAACIRERRPCLVDYRVLHVGGAYRWCAVKGVPLLNPDGSVREWVGTLSDIDERRRAELRLRDSEAALRVSEERLALALDSGSDGLWDWNIATGETWFSDRWQTMLGYAPGELEAHVRTWERLIHPDDRPRAQERLIAHFEGRSPAYECEHRLRRKDGGWGWVLARGKVTARDDDGRPLRIVGTHLDTTERREAERRIEHMALHDGLTDLPNRELLRERLTGALAATGPGSGGAALMLIDLDRFKTVNDTLGHQAGDALLRQVADRLRAAAGEGDVVARLGGDEFAILRRTAAQPEPRAAAEGFAQAVVAALAEPVTLGLGRHRVVVGASVGAAVASPDVADADDLFRRADLALYRAKAEGRSTVRFYEPSMDAAAEARQRLEIELRGAVARGEFELFFQPIRDLADGRVCTLEALLRWRHPQRGLVPPGEFIPLAEDAGLIGAIGEWVLREACRQAAAWPEAGRRVAVNISAVQLRDGGLPRLVDSALDASGLRPDRLEVEITETALMDAGAAGALDELRRLGVRIALDDFGTGFSSLSYLRRFPFDKIKIDRSFVAALDDPGTAAIVRSIIGLGRQLGMTITAEGVETEAQLAFLTAEGCGEAQGFLIGRPAPADPIAPRGLRARPGRKPGRAA